MSRSLFTLSLLFVFLAGCGGGAGGGSSAPSGSLPRTPPSSAQSARVTLTIVVPLPKSQALRRSPQSIDSLTHSLQVTVNGGAVQNFDVTGTTGGCTTSSVITCTETVLAPVGTTNVFLINTFSATGGGGVQLDTGSFSNVTVSANTANTLSFQLHPVVSTNAMSGAGSLAYAIGNASSGDLITFTSAVTSPLTLTSSLAISNNVTILGPGANSLTIDGAGSTQLFTIAAGTTAAIDGLSLAHGNSATNGGAVINFGSLTLINDIFNNNNASATGGAVYSAGPSLTMIGPSFISNTANRGGAVEIGAGSGTVSITTGTFNTNSATISGGAINLDSAATLDSDGFNFNTAGDLATNNGSGGAIYDNISGPATQTISNSTFDGNQALAGNASQGTGGAVYESSASGTLVLTSDIMGSAAGNVAKGQYGGSGGAVYTNGLLTVNGGTYSNNTAIGTLAGAFTNYGGALYAVGTLTVSGGLYTGNTAGGVSGGTSGAGGAINANAGSITSATFKNNAAIGLSGGTGNGGAICTAGAFLINLSTIGVAGSGNTATDAGAGFYGMGAVTDTLIHSTVDSNSIAGLGANPIKGAGIYNASGTTLNLTQDTISNNQLTNSTTAAGGGLYNAGTSAIANSTFYSNSSSMNGGNIFNASTVNIQLSTIAHGIVGPGSGGNLYNQLSVGFVTTYGSIYAYGVGPSGSGIDNQFSINSNDYNIFQNIISGSAPVGATGNNQTYDPMLAAAPAANGSLYGPLTYAPTNPLLVEKIPVAAGACTGTTITKDERGLARPGPSHALANCTIGAYEDQ
ncbi:MAG: hypothetical protein M3N19_08200 [Candidatus Eremiobacteraeota bacterium]|nr:hypothetical protein [Candidatus Eremiobacteraeota bacterium]